MSDEYTTKTDQIFKAAEYKINMKDAMELLKVKNVSRKCKSCGKYVPVINAVMGQRITCPECGAAYTVKQQIKFEVVIDPVLTA